MKSSLNYIDYGNAKKGTIVLLHGWGQNIEMMDMLGRPFAQDFRIIVLDLPGFGLSKEPEDSMNVTEYADFLNTFLTKLNVHNPILIGHSFGGRIAISYASRYKTNKIVLLSAPFRPNPRKKVSYKTRIYKMVKKIKCLSGLSNYLRNKWGSTDYRNASEINRQTLVKVVNEDLTESAKKIKCPSLLIYGAEDKDVLISEAKELERLIADAGLVIYPNAHHYAYLERLNQTITILQNFFE